MTQFSMNPASIAQAFEAPGAAAVDSVPGNDLKLDLKSAKLDFQALIEKSIDSVNTQLTQAGELAKQFEMGDPNVDLVRVMVEMQKARVSFEATSQIRNKFVEAYKEIMNMQV